MRKSTLKLSVRRETLRLLDDVELAHAATGGGLRQEDTGVGGTCALAAALDLQPPAAEPTKP
jgi:hypothetical protein